MDQIWVMLDVRRRSRKSIACIQDASRIYSGYLALVERHEIDMNLFFWATLKSKTLACDRLPAK